MKSLRIHPPAREEILHVLTFYREQQPGLEIRFMDALEDVLLRVRKHPGIYRMVESDVRKCRLPRFPYGIIFRERGDFVEVIALMHLRKSPGYWKSRV